MNETPDTSSMSLGPRSRMIGSGACCSGASVPTSASPLIATMVPPSPGRTHGVTFMIPP
jgi:hypothetical protein